MSGVLIKIKPDISRLNFSWLIDELKKYIDSNETIFEICFVVEEVIVNIIKLGEIKDSLNLQLIYKEKSIMIKLAFEGNKFNPFEGKFKGFDNPAYEQIKTKLNLQLKKRVAKEIHFNRIGRYNTLSFIVAIKRFNYLNIKEQIKQIKEVSSLSCVKLSEASN